MQVLRDVARRHGAAFASDDAGKTWRQEIHLRPFLASDVIDQQREATTEIRRCTLFHGHRK